MPLPAGKDLTMMNDPNYEHPRAQQNPTYISGQAGPSQGVPAPYVQPNMPIPNGKWRTILKIVGKPTKSALTNTRPTVTLMGSMMHIHSDRFDWVLSFDRIEDLEIEFGEVAPPHVVPDEPLDTVTESVVE